MEHHRHAGLVGHTQLILQQFQLALHRRPVKRVYAHLPDSHYARVGDSSRQHIKSLIHITLRGIPRVQPYHQTLAFLRDIAAVIIKT